MSEDFDTGDQSPPDGGDAPTLSCTRCNQTWDLLYELDELGVGNRAAEQFALDHFRHTGHYPDDVTPWVADCRRCPDSEQFLSERPAFRFGNTHRRHTGHEVTIRSPEGETYSVDTATLDE